MNIKSREPMAVRRADYALKLAMAEADRRARPWRRLTAACLAVGATCVPVAAVASATGHLDLAAGAFAASILGLLGAEVAAERAAR